MEELVGQLISHYKIVGVLGSGGMGSVLQAHDLSLDRDVAIKMLHPHLAEQSGFRERFLAEARIAARLSHPGIVQVYDFGQYRSYLYIVMQFIEGPNLRQLLDELCSKNQWIRLDETVQLISQVARALHYAHEKGILHRDIKPGNIMLKKEPGGTIEYQAVLTDLGLARLMTGEHFTLTGTTLGTPPYMSPEQAQGLEVDQRSDVYSLGILLFELAVGRLPFPIHSITDAIRYHTKEPPPLPRSIRPDLPLAIERIIIKAIQKKPEDRYRSAIELAKSLDEIAIEATTEDTTPTIREDGRPVKAVSLITQLQTSRIEPRGASILGEFPDVKPELTDRIQIMEPGKGAYSVKLDRKGMTLGRGSECDIQVSDPKVSSKHLHIDWDGQAYQVIDLQSKNGSFLANVRLLDQVPQKWDAGQALHIGDVWIRLVPAAERTDTVTSTDVVHTCSTDGALGVRIEPEQITVEPGSVVTIQVSIWNQSSTVNHYEISVQGIPSSWLAAPPPDVMLMDGEQKTIELMICPPRQPKSRAGRDPITVRVKKKEQREGFRALKTTEQFVEVHANLTVGAYWQFSSEMQPQRVQARHPARVTIHNQGNTRENFTITWEDREEALDFDPSEKQVQIPEGKAAMVEFTARPRQQRWMGGEKSHAFTTRITHSRAVQQQSGEIMSRGLIPLWVLPIFTILCLLLVGGMGAVHQYVILPTEHAKQTSIWATDMGLFGAQTATQDASDNDADGLSYASELRYDTDPNKADTDGDDLLDGEEIKRNTDPRVMDTDEDTWPDGYEVRLNTSPIKADTDDDGLKDNVDPDPIHLPTPTPEPTSTSTPTGTASPEPTSTPLPVYATITVDRLPLRMGPGEEYVFHDSESLKRADVVRILGKTPDGKWYAVLTQSSHLGWVSVSSVSAETSSTPIQAIENLSSLVISGKVISSKWTPLDGINVALYTQRNDLYMRADAYSDENGSFYFYAPMAGTWNVEVVGVLCSSKIMDENCHPRGYFILHGNESVLVPQTERIALTYEEATCMISGQAMNPNGQPIKDIRIVALRTDGARSWGSTLENGQFEIPGSDGTWDTYAVQYNPTRESQHITIRISKCQPSSSITITFP